LEQGEHPLHSLIALTALSIFELCQNSHGLDPRHRLEHLIPIAVIHHRDAALLDQVILEVVDVGLPPDDTMLPSLS